MDLGLAGVLAIALLAALVGGVVAARLHQPVVVGYLLAGIAIGPRGLGLIRGQEEVNLLAEIGVVLLMFSIGIELSLTELSRMRVTAFAGTAAQILLTIGLGILLGLSLGWPLIWGAFFGSVVALSSTMVVLKTLMDRGELDSIAGRLMVAFLVVQDLSVVALMVIWPAAVQPDGNWLVPLLLALVKAAAFLVIMVVVGMRVIPALLWEVARLRSRELLLVATGALILGAAAGTAAVGLSLAFGAFVAGLVISESEQSRHILGDVIPLRDIFATLFFVAIGMLAGPTFIVENAGLVAAVTAVVLLGKLLIFTAIVSLFRYAGAIALAIGLGLGQIGEFSFVLARVGWQAGIIPEQLYELTLATAIVTIVLTPPLFAARPGLVRLAAALAPLKGWVERGPRPVDLVRDGGLANHVVICGYGRVTGDLIGVLAQRDLKYVVVDYDPHVIADLRRRRVPCIYGDAGNAEVLAAADLKRARVLVIAVADPISTINAVNYARLVQPRLDIVVRASRHAELHLLRSLGANEVVEPEFEAGLEVIRHTLRRYGITGVEAQYQINRLRQEHYEPEVTE
ncbi:MAG: cation:proton antiporter [Chloroflexi bacterium]|nr:cation:proton antiporter [Chloroflexota bacterium]